MFYTLNDVAYLASQCSADKITLHWSATGYNYYDGGSYHLIIQGDGTIFSAHDNFDIRLSHTWMHNTGNIGISLAGCYDASLYADGTINWGTYPPTDEQIEVMAQIVAAICKAKGWEITKDRVKTHAEWAEIDGYSYKDDDPDMRWDLLKVPQEDGEGGDVLRGKANWYLNQV